jgi:hypothetical protein
VKRCGPSPVKSASRNVAVWPRSRRRCENRAPTVMGGLRGIVVGSNGPDMVVGRATTKGTWQTELSKPLTPPKKWSYLKLFRWSLLVFLSLGWIVFYVNTIVTNSSSVSSLPLTICVVLSGSVLLVVCLIYWNHNRSGYPRQYAQWERSFICNRCGVVCDQD